MMRGLSLLLVLGLTGCAVASEDAPAGGPRDTAGSDGAGDTAADGAGGDASKTDSSPGTDSGTTDTTTPDTATPDTGTGPVDTGTPDTGTPDTGTTDTGTTDTGTPDTGGCTVSPVVGCSSGAVVIGHYAGGPRTIDIVPGSTNFKLALLSYDASSWTLTGATTRVTSLQIFSYAAGTTIAGNGGIPTTIQTGPTGTCNPYSYATSLGECPAHTGWAGCKFSVPSTSVCNMESGLTGACSYPTYSCLRIAP